jgi:hypothetical protein
MSDHAWFEESLAGYSAGGLSAEERERFERHAARCQTCARALADWRGLDDTMEDLFAEARPAAGLEDRLIRRLRQGPPRRQRWPLMARFGACAAAVLFLGLLGAALQGSATNGGLPFPGTWGRGVTASNNLKHAELRRGTSSHGQIIDDSRSGSMPGRVNINSISDGRLIDAITDGTANTITFSEQDRTKLPAKEADKQEKKVLDKQIADHFRSFGFSPDGGRLLASGGNGTVRLWDEATGPALRPQEGLLGTDFGDQNEDAGKKGGEVKGKFFAPALALIVRSPGRVHTQSETGPGASTPKKDDGERGEKAISKEAVDGRKAEPGQDKRPAQEEPGKTPPAVGRKIIRTGDIEFEVDSFDAAAAGINRLINGISGALVATTNSDRLPNGKVKGSIVVRMPPQALDKFLLDLRKELTKAGVLKSLRIGSDDVSKRYFDLESRLRAARTTQERLLNIIKTGKGEIKDLVVAEQALAKVLGEIEQMEGDIRYYNNQVALSTLTITLYEKEIRAPSALVVTEHMNLVIEVEDVQKAQKEAEAAAASAKARVLKAEQKLLPGGQVEAILEWAVPPAAAGPLRDRLAKLGTVTGQDATRLQQAEGGVGPPQDLKPQVNDVRVKVDLYNTASVQPRETFNLKLATGDVAGGYDKLREAIARAGGQISKGNMKEPDRLRRTAELDFTIPTPQRSSLEKVLADIGAVLSRSTAQAPPDKTATDRKIGYSLVLLNAAAIPPRERVKLELEVKDVDQTKAAMTEWVRAVKGVAAPAQVSYERSGQVSAVLHFDVPLAAKDELLHKLRAAGTVRDQKTEPNPLVPESALATAHIEVKLTSAGPIVPEGQGLWPRIRTSLSYTFEGLSWSLMVIILGVCVVLPWALLLWGVLKLVRHLRKAPTGPAV